MLEMEKTEEDNLGSRNKTCSARKPSLHYAWLVMICHEVYMKQWRKLNLPGDRSGRKIIVGFIGQARSLDFISKLCFPNHSLIILP